MTNNRLFTPLRPACETEKLMRCMYLVKRLLEPHIQRLVYVGQERGNRTTQGPYKISRRKIIQTQIDADVVINQKQEVVFADGTTGTVYIVFNKRLDTVRITIYSPGMQYTFSTKNHLNLLKDLEAAFPKIRKKIADM